MTKLFDVGGYGVAADVVAGGGPAILFISGRGDGRAIWARILPLLRDGTATITYDRAGIADSEPRPVRGPHPYSVLTSELLALLDCLPVTGPYVIVAHSFGALVARSLASQHPDLVAGFVLLDGSVDEVALWPGGTPPVDGPRPDATLLDYQAGAAELAQARYPKVPAVVITRTPGRWTSPLATELVDQRWTSHQHAIAENLGATLLVACDSGHYLHHEAAELVAAAVNAVTSALLVGDGQVHLDITQIAAIGGRVAQ